MSEPWYKDGNRWWSILIWGFFILVFTWTPITDAYNATSKYLATIPVTCTDKKLPFKTITQEDSSLNEAESYTTPGIEGLDRVCTGKDGSDQGHILKTLIVDAIYHKGTKVDPPDTPIAPVYRSAPVYEESGDGAICSDGWRSYSTGRGTCSHHGGVAYWL